MGNPPNKIFVYEEEEYIEISYEEFQRILEQDENRFFLPLHGMLMEVDEAEYQRFYKEERRERYLIEQAIKHREVSYDALPIKGIKKEDVLIDESADLDEIVSKKEMLSNLYEAIETLEDEEKELILAIYCEGMTEREYAEQKGMYHNAIHYRKKRILEKLKELLKRKK